MAHEIKKVKVANGLWEKGVGVMFWKDFRGFNGLLLTSTNAVHSFFVRFPLDLVFLDADYKIVKLVHLKPYSLSPIVLAAKHTLELPEGSIKKHSLKTGDGINLV